LSSLDWNVALVFLALAIVLVVAHFGGWVAAKCGQPRVVGEIAAGILLGPSLLGAMPGHLDIVLFPDDVRPFLTVVAQLGLVVFMFIVGLETEPAAAGRVRKAAAFTAAGSMALPLVAGSVLALAIYSDHRIVDGHVVDRTAFVLLISAAIAITAFPVLAKILDETNLSGTRIGVTALVSASLNDLAAWILLAGVVIVSAGGSWSRIVLLVLQAVVVVLVVRFVLAPALRRVCESTRNGRRAESLVSTLTMAGLFACSWATAALGLHAVIGAFVFGLFAPREQLLRAAPQLQSTMAHIGALLLPVFFVTAGFSVNIRIGWDGLVLLVVVLLTACSSKILGAGVGSLLGGSDRRESVVLGLLMNTRGLTELIVLAVGLDLGLLDSTLYTVLVLVALITTAITGPLVRRRIKAEPLLLTTA
jgi:Kef-type K+ transport system membrane component KefB